MTDYFTGEDVQLAVKRGAYWLDENHPGWASRINLSNLQMRRCDQCVIGQAVGDYYETVIEGSQSEVDEDVWAETHGFQCLNFYGQWLADAPWSLISVANTLAQRAANAAADRYYAKLEEVWTDEVRKRLG